MDQGALAAVPKNFKDKVQCRGYNLDTSQPGAIFEEDARAILEQAIRRISEPVRNTFVAVFHQNQPSIVSCTFHIQTPIFLQRAPQIRWYSQEFLRIAQSFWTSVRIYLQRLCLGGSLLQGPAVHWLWSARRPEVDDVHLPPDGVQAHLPAWQEKSLQAMQRLFLQVGSSRLMSDVVFGWWFWYCFDISWF